MQNCETFEFALKVCCVIVNVDVFTTTQEFTIPQMYKYLICHNRQLIAKSLEASKMA